MSNDVLVVLALSESQGLINWFSRVSDDLIEFQGTQLVPFVFGGFQSDSMGICSDVVVILERGLRRSVDLAARGRDAATSYS